MLPASSSKKSYSCDGVQTKFPITFTYKDHTKIDVWMREDATEGQSQLTYTTDYTINTDDEVVTVDTWDSGYTLVIMRVLDVEQQTDYEPHDKLPANTLELSFDDAVKMLQQHNEMLSRALLLPETCPHSNISFPEPDDQYSLIWDGTNLVNATKFSAGDITVQSFMETFLESVDKPTARDNLRNGFKTFSDGDTTPSVSNSDYFKTNNSGATTITMFDDGKEGQTIKVIINDGNTTVDFTGTNLKGNTGADWSPSSGDWLEAIFDGTNWYCSVHDTTV